MNQDEAKQTLRDSSFPIVRVTAVARPAFKDIMEYRFPGFTYNGYILASPNDVLVFADWIYITRIEEW